jgi:hypothetical protein
MRIEKIAQTVFTPLADGTGVLLNLDTLVYCKLNRTAAALWQEIDSSAAYTLDDLVHYAHQFLREFVARLAEFKMIRIA